MAKRRSAAGNAAGEVNMTPMIDCTFQLIIFFILTAQMASEQAKVLVPEPKVSQAISEEEGTITPGRVTVNVVSKCGDKEDNRDSITATQAKHYQVGAEIISLEDIPRLVQILTEQLSMAMQRGIQEKDFYVEIRGDKDIAFSGIEPVLHAAAAAKIKKMSITAIVDKSVKKTAP
ncbi:MAG: biopolymer transporter ExbD [Phycisphaerae bacterium]|nr:biopolymer transporter ExbD [Phycisphaerae bacterium]